MSKLAIEMILDYWLLTRFSRHHILSVSMGNITEYYVTMLPINCGAARGLAICSPLFSGLYREPSKATFVDHDSYECSTY